MKVKAKMIAIKQKSGLKSAALYKPVEIEDENTLERSKESYLKIRATLSKEA